MEETHVKGRDDAAQRDVLQVKVRTAGRVRDLLRTYCGSVCRRGFNEETEYLTGKVFKK